MLLLLYRGTITGILCPVLRTVFKNNTGQDGKIIRQLENGCSSGWHNLMKLKNQGKVCD